MAAGTSDQINLQQCGSFGVAEQANGSVDTCLLSFDLLILFSSRKFGAHLRASFLFSGDSEQLLLKKRDYRATFYVFALTYVTGERYFVAIPKSLRT